MWPQTEQSPAAKRKKNARIRLRIWNVIGILLCALLLPVIIINITLMVQTFIHPDIPPSFMGLTPLAVESGSMSPFFDEGSLVIVRSVDRVEAQDLEPGTVICFQSGSSYVTHRITQRSTEADGSVRYTMQGDANNTPDVQPVSPDQILGVYVTHAAGLGDFVLYLQTPVGMICCVVLPALLIFGAFWLSSRLADRRERKALAAKKAQVSQE